MTAPRFHLPAKLAAVWIGVAAALLLGPRGACGQSGPETAVWRVHPGDAHGFDPFALAEAVNRASEIAPPLTSLVIARDTTTVAEAYFGGMNPSDGANLKSEGKSVLSALVGIALDEGALSSVEQPISPFFPQLLADSPRKQRITIHQLLTQQTGLESTSFQNYGPWVTSDDWVAHALGRPMVDRPGGDMIYSTGNTHILGAVLSMATGQSLRAYAQNRLFDPLGVRIRNWQRSPQGRYFGGNNMALTPRGMLRFGQLYLNDGRFRGQQILSPDWIRESWRTYVRFTYHDHQYGYLWFTHTFGGERVAFAWGHGGQYIFVVPRLDLVVACTSSLSNRPPGSDGHNEQILRLLGEHIIPAARGSDPLGMWLSDARPVIAW